MMYRAAAVLAFFVPAASLQDAAQSRPASRPAESKPAPRTVREKGKVFEVYGEGVAMKSSVPLPEVVGKIAEYDGKTVRLEGVVESVCPKKGCWMWIADGDSRVFVKFKDYGFFVPKDCTGQELVVEGIVKKKMHSVDEARHYAEDRGDHEGAKKITEPQPVTEVVATGVHLAPKPEAPGKSGGKAK